MSVEAILLRARKSEIVDGLKGEGRVFASLDETPLDQPVDEA